MNVWYQFANQSFEEKFCKNMDKPELSCHGSCMMKKINLEPISQNDFESSEFTIQLKLSEFQIDKLNLSLLEIPLRNILPVDSYLFSYDLYWIRDIFHPPESPAVFFMV